MVAGQRRFTVADYLRTRLAVGHAHHRLSRSALSSAKQGSEPLLRHVALFVDSKAILNISGSFLPRFSARRSIPSHAF